MLWYYGIMDMNNVMPDFDVCILWILEAQKLGLGLHVGTWDPIWAGPWIECNIEGPGAVQGVGGTPGVEAVLKRVGILEGMAVSAAPSLPCPSGPLVWSS
jgi:hypothetical protein